MRSIILFFVVVIVVTLVGCEAPAPLQNEIKVEQKEGEITSVIFSSNNGSAKVVIYRFLNNGTINFQSPVDSLKLNPVGKFEPSMDGSFAAKATKTGYKSQWKGFQVVRGVVTPPVEFQMVEITELEPELKPKLVLSFPGALPDSIILKKRESEWKRIKISAPIEETMEISLKENSLYSLSVYKFGEEYEREIFFTEQSSVALKFDIPAELVEFVFASEISCEVSFWKLGNDTEKDYFGLTSSSSRKKAERGEFYWVSFSTEEPFWAQSQLVLADKEKVIQPRWNSLPQAPDTVQIVKRDTIVFINTEIDTIYMEGDTLYVPREDSVVIHDTTEVIREFYRERLVSSQEGFWVGTRDWNKKLSRQFTTLFPGYVYIWGKEIRGQMPREEEQTNESFICSLYRLDTGELLGRRESPDTGEGETVRLMVKSDSPVPEGTPVKVVWESNSPNLPPIYDSIHIPEATAQNFAPEFPK